MSDSELLSTHAWEGKESPTDLRYEVVPGWREIPEDWILGQVAGVSADSENRIYFFHRGSEPPPLLCFNSNGKLPFSWDHIAFGLPHMVPVDAGDNVLTDDGAHIICVIVV